MLWTSAHVKAIDDLIDEDVPALRTMHRGGAFLTDLLEELGVLLTRPLVLARLLALMDFFAEAIFFVCHS